MKQINIKKMIQKLSNGLVGKYIFNIQLLVTYF